MWDQVKIRMMENATQNCISMALVMDYIFYNECSDVKRFHIIPSMLVSMPQAITGPLKFNISMLESVETNELQ